MARPIYNAKYENSWALVVGINEYEHASRLGYATNDATAFAEQLTSRFGFPDANVSIILDKDATLQNIRGAMHKLARGTTEEDRIIVFYAGHGHTVPAYGREAGFLVPVDGRADDTSTLLTWDDLVNTSRIIRAKHMLFIMDACYGGLIGMRALSPGAKRFVRDMLSRYSRQFLTAGKADEVVADCGGPRNGHSVFTGHLLNALEGEMQASDGLISANALMAHVYSRVAQDPHSLQAPHYGFLAGDGDLFFTIPVVETDPSKPKDTGDVMIEVPPDLLAPEEATAAPPLLERVKEYLSDRKHRIALDDLVMRELRTAQQRLGEENFSVQGSNITKQDFADRLLKYENASSDLLKVSALLGRWAEDDQQAVIRQIVNAIAGQIESKGGLTLWLSLRYYPMLLVMYAAGMSAIHGENYRSLKTLFTTPVQNQRRGDTTAVVQATTEAMLDVSRMDAFKFLPDFERKYTPQSEYLFTRMQPTVEDLLFLGNRYEDCFDRFEILYALVFADLSNTGWGHPGRFAWKYRSRGRSDDPYTALVEEAKGEGDNWAPLRAGFFRGSHDHFAVVAERYRTELLDKLSWF